MRPSWSRQAAAPGQGRERPARAVEETRAGKVPSSQQRADAELRWDDADDSQVLNVSLVTLGNPQTMTGGYLYHRRIAELAPVCGAKVEFVSFPAWPFPLPALAGPAVLRAVAERRPDILLLDSIAAAFFGLWRTRRRSPVPLVGIVHQPPGGIDHGPIRTGVQAFLDRRAHRQAARLLVASAPLAHEMGAWGFPGELLRVIPPGRDVASDIVLPTTDLRAGRKAAVLAVGNWVERKGLLDLLAAVAALPPESVTLHLVGDTGTDPGYATRVRARIAAPDLVGRVVVHGPRSINEVAGFYQAADVFALTSVREPYGTVYGEAMAAGLPVVGWDTGNLPHLARDGVEGRVVPQGDHAELTAALAELAENEPLRRRLAAGARRRAATFPTWRETANDLFAELRVIVREAAA